MKTFLTSLALLFFLSACGGGSSSLTAAQSRTPERITFSGAGDLGIFDPSVTRDLVTDRLWMSYSSVNTSPNYSSQDYWAVSIRLAYSDDNGVSWQDAGVAVSPASERTDFGPLKGGVITANSNGIWQSEMSSLVYDPSATAGEEWKLIWIQYLHADTTSFFADYSWVAMKMASTPSGLAAATPVKLFGGAGLQTDNINTVSPVFAPIGGSPMIQINTEITNAISGAAVSELNLCIFAEPGLHATSSAVYLAIYCADASTILSTGSATEYLVYFRCNSPCTMTSAASWEYLGRLLSPTDAQSATGDHHYQAPALAEKITPPGWS